MLSVIAAFVFIAFVIVVSMAGVFDRTGVGLAVDRYLQASAGFVFMTQCDLKPQPNGTVPKDR